MEDDRMSEYIAEMCALYTVIDIIDKISKVNQSKGYTMRSIPLLFLCLTVSMYGQTYHSHPIEAVCYLEDSLRKCGVEVNRVTHEMEVYAERGDTVLILADILDIYYAGKPMFSKKIGYQQRKTTKYEYIPRIRLWKCVHCNKVYTQHLNYLE